MKLIVDVPDEEYKTLSELSEKEKVNELSGYEKIIANGIPYEEKQGKWILQYRSCGDAYYACSICNRTIEVENGQSLKDYPFCHCGADMRKGGAE